MFMIGQRARQQPNYSNIKMRSEYLLPQCQSTHGLSLHGVRLSTQGWTLNSRRASSLVSQIRLSRFSLAKPRNTLVSAVSSFTPARRCLLGVADGLAAQSQLKRLGNAVVDGFVYFAASDSGTSQLMLTTS